MTGWPWPLNGVQSWFDSFWNWVSTSAFNAARWMWNQVTAGLDSLQGSLSSGLTWLSTKVSEGISGLKTRLSEGWTWISQVIYEKVTWVATQVSAGLTWLYNSVAGAISQVSTWITNGLTWLQSAITQGLNSARSFIMAGISNLGSQLSSGLSNLWTAISTTVGNVVTAVTGAVSGLWDSLTGLAGDLLSGVTEALGSGLQGFFDWILKHLTWFGQMVIGAVNSVVAAIQGFIMDLGRRFIDSLTGIFTAGSPDKKLENTMRVMVDTMNKRVVDEIKAMYKSTPEVGQVLATAGTVATLLGVGILSVKVLAASADAANPIGNIGFKDIASHMIAATGASMAMSSILMMPAQIGLITPLRHAYNAMFTPEIPGSMDLIRFVVREVIPKERFFELMPLHGFSREYAEYFWDSHWRDIAEGRIHEAYHRKLITKAERDKFIVLLDYRPDPRPGITVSDAAIVTGLAKTLIPRVDLRYAWEMGDLTDDGLVERYEWLGYEDDSELMADIQKTRALIEEIHKVRDEWLADFIEGFTDEGTLRANMEEVGIGPARIEYYCQYARKRREREHKKALLDIYEDGYQKDLIEYPAFESRVNEILVDKDAADVFIEKAWIKKHKAPKAS